MKRRRNRAFGLISLLCLTVFPSCATTLKVTYYSDPPGAALYQDQQSFGYTPVTLSYKIQDEHKKQGYINIRGTSVRWASGATASIPRLRANLSLGTNLTFKFIRPENVPGRDKDMLFALELERIQLMRQQTQAMQRQAQAQQDQAKALLELFNKLNQQQLLLTPRIIDLNCSSRMVGNIILTSCY